MVIPSEAILPAQRGSDEEVLVTEEPTQAAAQLVNTTFSESVLSEESSIFNAPRTNSGAEDTGQKFGPDTGAHGSLDSRIVANMAMFIPLAPEAPDPSQRPNREPKYLTEQKTQSSGWHPQLAPDSRVLSTDEGKAIVLSSPPDESLKRSLFDALRLQKAASLNDADDTGRIFKWPGSLDSPVSPVLPTYPPPVRAPTPPGLPSFGTREAIYYSAQYPVHSATASGHTQQPDSSRSPGRRGIHGTRTGSYGEALRRLLSFPSSPPTQPRRQTYAVARAADGTAVQGRFPYRQSGHGMNLARRLEDHPFHRSEVLAARGDNVNVEGFVTQHAQVNREDCDLKHAQPVAPSSPGVDSTPRGRPRFALNSLLPAPRPVMADTAQRPASANASLPTYRVDSFHTCFSLSQSPGAPTPDTQGAERVSESPACFLAPTQSAPISAALEACGRVSEPSPWRQPRRIMRTWFCCCPGERNEQDAAVYSNTSSNETYTTARTHPGGNAADNPRTGAPEDPAQRPMSWLLETWRGFQVFASRNLPTMSLLPA
ncbi:hypothetical protein BO70DRAFT_427515 [Aspergillus heteromorphus CBS 117.55]|uniref:Uncharacterized protein n=1 Tax=Aspergillus heteromorphus CBS 117.55 TaxID=1448321 RepID=A0A317WMA1_9EURO|nr:uncharacterized protein BO70DRAFT_427515 [Aspergillus heteromorphus CBS 117.55]PWY87594.1 hypothetical protein BO70DRAFT_427515 [Aspergillus heteromorphus CBS 117.55]